MVSFVVQKLLSLIKSHLVIFIFISISLECFLFYSFVYLTFYVVLMYDDDDFLKLLSFAQLMIDLQ